MSDNHPTTREQDARRESFAAGLTGAARPLVLRRGLRGSWTRAALKMASQSMARRTMGLAVLLVARHGGLRGPGAARAAADDGRAAADGRAADGRAPPMGRAADDGRAPDGRAPDGSGRRWAG